MQASIEKQDFVPIEDSALNQDKSFLEGKFINSYFHEASTYEYLKWPYIQFSERIKCNKYKKHFSILIEK